MTTEQLIQSFIAFNRNAVNNFIYTFSSNTWFIIITICAVAFVALNLRDALEDYVTEEQNIT